MFVKKYILSDSFSEYAKFFIIFYLSQKKYCKNKSVLTAKLGRFKNIYIMWRFVTDITFSKIAKCNVPTPAASTVISVPTVMMVIGCTS